MNNIFRFLMASCHKQPHKYKSNLPLKTFHEKEVSQKLKLAVLKTTQFSSGTNIVTGVNLIVKKTLSERAVSQPGKPYSS